MILLAVLALAIIIGLIRGGSLCRFGELSLHQGGWALAALLLQLLLLYGSWLNGQAAKPGTVISRVAVGAMLLSYLLLFVFVWLNRHLPGIGLLGLGLFLNFLVMAANGGYMPTSPEALQLGGYATPALPATPGTRLAKSKDIILPREQTKLWFLSDLFVIPPPFPWPTVFSGGDIAIAVGVFILVQRAMLGFGRGRKA